MKKQIMFQNSVHLPEVYWFVGPKNVLSIYIPRYLWKYSANAQEPVFIRTTIFSAYFIIRV